MREGGEGGRGRKLLEDDDAKDLAGNGRTVRAHERNARANDPGNLERRGDEEAEADERANGFGNA